jgi:hypothetical protein
MERRIAEARAIELAWHLFWEVDGDISFSEIMMRVKAHCPGIDPARVRAEFVRRLANGGSHVRNPRWRAGQART